MTDKEFETLRRRYQSWKAHQSKGEQTTEDDILRWAYDVSQDDAAERIIERLFGTVPLDTRRETA